MDCLINSFVLLLMVSFFFLYGFKLGKQKGWEKAWNYRLDLVKEFWYEKGFRHGKKAGYEEGNREGVKLAATMERIISKTRKGE